MEEANRGDSLETGMLFETSSARSIFFSLYCHNVAIILMSSCPAMFKHVHRCHRIGLVESLALEGAVPKRVLSEGFFCLKVTHIGQNLRYIGLKYENKTLKLTAEPRFRPGF